jgi:hypothetical protein
MMGDMLEENCPNKDNLYFFLVGEISEKEKGEIELHLAGCADCRRDLSALFSESVNNSQNFKTPESLVEEVKKIPEKEADVEKDGKTSTQTVSAPWYSMRFVQVVFASSLIFLLGIFGIYLLQIQPDKTPEDILRNGSSNKNSIQLVSPENDNDISDGKISFSWLKIADAKNYTLILSDEKGDIVKEIKTEMQNVEASVSELDLMAGKHYFWQIKATFADGSVSESETRKFLNKNQ